MPVLSIKDRVFTTGAEQEGDFLLLSGGIAEVEDVLQGGFTDHCTCALCFQAEAVPWDAARLTAPALPGPRGK